MARRRGNYKLFAGFAHYVPGFGGLFMLLLMLLIGALLGNLVSMLFPLFLEPEDAVEYSTLVSYPLMFIPPMIYAMTVSRSHSYNEAGLKLDNSHFSPLGAVVCVLLVIFSTLALGLCSEPLSSLLPPMPAWLEQVLKSMTGGRFWVNFLCVSIFAPFFEEWLCRGMVLRGLLGKGVKPIWAIACSALFFAFIHLNPWQAIPAFLFGMLFGYVYYRTGSLRLTMLMHFVNNTFSLVVSRIDSLADMDSWSEVIPSPQYWILVAACALFVCATVYAFGKIKPVSASGSFDKVDAVFSE
ncbi:MAG: CPBP family intramembrane metalloprotease [Bacteroidales bacterium]|nr:CPBP family intramembrane metalloprotease [Bacteroidales bacterium]